MAGAVVETQRLITMSLGKIAQSRGQRGGINLHKNLLVASVLHKARTAFMMENSYNYHVSLQQQQQIVLKQKLHAEEQTVPQSSVESEPRAEAITDSEACQATSCQMTTLSCAESRSTETETQSMDELSIDNSATSSFDLTELHDKENVTPPSSLESSSTAIPCSTAFSHLESANQLAATVAKECQEESSSQSQTSHLPCKFLSSPTSALKRRRENPDTSSADNDCSSPKHICVVSDQSKAPSLDNCQSQSDMCTLDSPQITNLVSIFNSGFSGLCAVNSQSPNESSQSQSMPLKISDSYCSSHVERIGSLSSAIVLSA